MTPLPLPHLAARIFGQPLLITRAKLDIILSVLAPRLRLDLPPPSTAAVEAKPTRTGYAMLPGGVAMIPIHGTLVQRAMGLDALSGLTSYEQIDAQFESALSDRAVTEIILDIDSPGGEAAGVFDLADRIYESRGQKPISAMVNESAFSAAYALASAADRIILPRTGGVGSIGVIATHIDESAADTAEGLTITHIYAGAHKADMSPHQPLSDDARAWLQTEVDRLYDLFVETVARNRGLSTAAVRGTDARIYMGGTALSVGLADEIAPAAHALGRIVGRNTGDMSMSANAPGTPAPDDQPPTPAPSPQPVPQPPRQDPAAIAEACAAAGVPEMTAALLREGLTLDQAQARIAAAGTIRNLCAAAHMPERAAGFIAAGKTPDQARAALFDALVQADQGADTQSHTVPDWPRNRPQTGGSRAKQAIAAYNAAHGIRPAQS